MNTIQHKILPVVWENRKCLGTTKKGIPCYNKITRVRLCDYKGVCKKHLTQIPKFKYIAETPNELPKNVLKLLPFELWVDIFEKIPKRPCKVLSLTKNDDYHCRSCGKFYKNSEVDEQTKMYDKGYSGYFII